MKHTYKHTANPLVKGLRIFGFVILGAIGVAFLALIFGYFVMLLWNWLMPMLFNLTTITFWQAVGIVILARLIFGGFKHGKSDTEKHKPMKEHFFDRWKDEYHQHQAASDWRYFDDYWEDEGEEAYQNYIRQKKTPDDK
ncbi:MAG: hypothetical protein V2I54_06540 [Bacteroidales bacterium]|jgi:hypothetical protein|nr:hypothetical protein [Bacteroidales bacterium]